jgi:hypothetical protein
MNLSLNRKRAAWAAKALAAFGREVGEDDTRTLIPDLIADLGHLASLRRLDFLRIAAQALSVWAYERKAPEGTGPCPQTCTTFGSNEAGRHGKGAALHARQLYGAQNGVGFGRTGDAWAIPTKDAHLRALPLERIAHYVGLFLTYAREHPEATFKVAAIRTGLAAYKHEDIAPMFARAPENCPTSDGMAKPPRIPPRTLNQKTMPRAHPRLAKVLQRIDKRLTRTRRHAVLSIANRKIHHQNAPRAAIRSGYTTPARAPSR